MPDNEVRIDKLINKAGSNSELERMLIKLRDDKYLQMWSGYPLKEDGQKDIGQDLITYWSITFDGRLFIEQGGYAQAKINAAQNERRIIQNEQWLIFATFFAGLAGFALFGMEVWKFYVHHL